MCGIVATITKASNGFTKKNEDTFWDMLFADTLRGDDSTGVVTIYQDGSFGYLKEALAAPFSIGTFQEHKLVKDMWPEGKAYIGHNRKATIGKIKDENAHPFVVDKKFIMVHNGTLTTHKHLADVEIDSEALAIHLSKYLHDDFDLEAFEEAMGKVYGAYAIVAYNMEANKIYFMRNKERPLCLFEDQFNFHLSSEFGLGAWCMSRNGLYALDKKAMLLDEHTLYTLDLDTNQLSEQKFTPKKPMAVAQVKTAGTTAVYSSVRSSTTTQSRGTNNHKILSKNEFKRLKRRHLGHRMQFWVDDYVEKFFPRTIAQGETIVQLMGNNEYLQVDNEIHGEFDILEAPPGIEDFTDQLYMGIVDDMTYNASNGLVTIRVHSVEMVKPAKISYNGTKDTVVVH